MQHRFHIGQFMEWVTRRPPLLTLTWTVVRRDPTGTAVGLSF